jgi:hypothetical protein
VRNLAKNNNDDILVNENKKHNLGKASEFIEDESATGDMAGLETDDDMLENAHDMGLYKADDGEHPQELNLAAQVQSAEDNRRGLD